MVRRQTIAVPPPPPGWRQKATPFNRTFSRTRERMNRSLLANHYTSESNTVGGRGHGPGLGDRPHRRSIGAAGPPVWDGSEVKVVEVKAEVGGGHGTTGGAPLATRRWANGSAWRTASVRCRRGPRGAGQSLGELVEAATSGKKNHARRFKGPRSRYWVAWVYVFGKT